MPLVFMRICRYKFSLKLGILKGVCVVGITFGVIHVAEAVVYGYILCKGLLPNVKDLIRTERL